MSKPRDNQRSKVYKWEKELRAQYDVKPTLSVAECQELVNVMHSKLYKNNSISPAPRVTDGRGSRRPYHCSVRNVIAMPKFARSRSLVCHEYAHYLTYTPFTEVHGAFFVSTFINLMAEYANDEIKMSVEGMRAMAQDMGVKC